MYSLSMNPSEPLIVQYRQREVESGKKKGLGRRIRPNENEYDTTDPFVDDSEFCEDTMSAISKLTQTEYPAGHDYYVHYGQIEKKKVKAKQKEEKDKNPDNQGPKSGSSGEKKKQDVDVLEKLYRKEMDEYREFVSSMQDMGDVNEELVKERIQRVMLLALTVPGLNITWDRLYDMVSVGPVERERVQQMVEMEMFPRIVESKQIELNGRIEMFVERVREQGDAEKIRWTEDMRRLVYDIVELEIEIGAITRFLRHETSKVLTLKTSAYSKIFELCKSLNPQWELGIPEIGKVYNVWRRKVLKSLDVDMDVRNEEDVEPDQQPDPLDQQGLDMLESS